MINIIAFLWIILWSNYTFYTKKAEISLNKVYNHIIIRVRHFIVIVGYFMMMTMMTNITLNWVGTSTWSAVTQQYLLLAKHIILQGINGSTEYVYLLLNDLYKVCMIWLYSLDVYLSFIRWRKSSLQKIRHSLVGHRTRFNIEISVIYNRVVLKVLYS